MSQPRTKAGRRFLEFLNPVAEDRDGIARIIREVEAQAVERQKLLPEPERSHLLRRARELQKVRTGHIKDDLAELATAYGISWRTLYRYLRSDF